MDNFSSLFKRSQGNSSKITKNNFSNNISTFIKKYYFEIIIFFITILIRIPRELNIFDIDTYEILWMAQAIVNGALVNSDQTWLINFFSYFGFYPFSHYPIGIPLLLSIFLFLDFPIWLAYFLITLIEITITYFGIRKIAKYLFDNKLLQYFLIIMYVNCPILLRFSYMTLHPRAFIMAFVPWFLYYVLKSFDSPNKKNILLSLFFLVLMIFTHRLWIGLIAFIIPALLTKLTFRKIDNVRLNKNKAILLISIIIILNIALLFLSLRIFNIDPRKIESPWFSNEYPLELLANVALDYATRIGVTIIFLPFGIFDMFKRLYKMIYKNLPSNLTYKEKRSTLFFLYSLFFVSISWNITLYSTVLFLIYLVFYTTLGFNFVIRNFKKVNIKLLSFIFLLYSAIVSLLYIEALKTSVLWLQILAIFIGAISIIGLINQKSINQIENFILRITSNRKLTNLSQMSFILILISVSFFSVTVRDATLRSSEKEFPVSRYITDEEKEIISVIKDHGVTGIIFCASDILAWHIGGYGFLPTIKAFHQPQQLYYNWVDKDYVLKNTVFNFWELINFAKLFVFDYNPENELYETVRQMNLTYYHEQLPVLKELNIQYCVALKNERGKIYPVTITTFGASYSVFLETLSFLSPLYQTQHLLLYKFY